MPRRGAAPVRTITSRSLRVFLDRAAADGLDVGAVLARHGVPAEKASHRLIDVPLHVLQILPDEIARLLSEPLLGARLAAALPRGAYGLTEFVMRCAPTLRESCRRMASYPRLFSEPWVCEYEEHRSIASIRFSLPDEPLFFGRQGNELVIAFIVRILRESLGRPWWPRRVWFSHAAPDPLPDYRPHFGTARVELGQDSMGFEVAHDDLDLPMTSSDPGLLRILDERAAKFGATASPRSDFVLSVREQIRRQLGSGAALEEVAAALALSTRTLQRRLVERGTGYKALVDDVRRELCTSLLRDEQLGVAEIGFALGYSDLPTFTRAFRRWTGQTPAQFRAKL